MRRYSQSVLFLPLMLLFLLPVPAPGKPRGPANRLAIVGATVVDATGAPPRRNAIVLVAEGKIAAIAGARVIAPPADAEILDAAGKFLIPGLWDMHMHGAGRPGFLDLYIAHGVTGVRDMFGPLNQIQARRKEIREGSRIGPRIVAAGRVLDGPLPILPGGTAVNNAEEARKEVAAARAARSDFIKIYSLLPRDAFFAVADEAKNLGIPFAGHVPEAVSVQEASDAGMRSIEHLTGILAACSPYSDRLRQQIVSDVEKGEGGLSAAFRSFFSSQVHSLESFDPTKAREVFRRLKRNGTWVCPTLTVLRGFAFMDVRSFTSDPRRDYVSPWMRLIWNPETSIVNQNLNAEDFANLKRLFARQVALAGLLHKAGVRLLAGTDASGPYCFPGFSLHDELELLVKAGLSPMEALQAATRNAAEFQGLLSETGTLEKGKSADMVLLDADPLQDIRNTRRIRSVIVSGRVLSRKELDAALLRAKEVENR